MSTDRWITNTERGGHRPHRRAIRLDAYDAPHGAGGFYARCGFREVGRVTYRKSPLVYFEALLAG